MATADGADIDVATRLAKEADVAVVLVASFAKEGVDRQSLSFEANSDGTCQFAAPAQDALVTLVAAAGARIVVAAAAPGAMLTPWRNQVQAILHGFMPGQEVGISGLLTDEWLKKISSSNGGERKREREIRETDSQSKKASYLILSTSAYGT